MCKPCLTFACLALALLSFPTFGDEGRTPIFAAPTVVAAPGRYFVTANLAVAAGSLITITADNVDLDLNGFVLSSAAAAPVITATGVNGVTIRNGTLSGGGPNIFIDAGTRIVIEDVQAIGAGPFPVAGIRLDDCTQIAVRRVVIRGAGGYGIEVNNGSLPSVQGTIADNLIESSWGGIQIIWTSGFSILNNRLTDLLGYGIYASGFGCLIAGNTLNAIGGTGMLLGAYQCTIRDNVASGGIGSSTGIQQNGDDSLILNNAMSRFDGLGVVILGNRNYLKDNVVNSNGSFGFHIVGTNNVYRGNVARGNAGVAGIPASCAAPCSPDLCVAPAAAGTSAGDNFLPGPPAFPACI